MMSTNIPATLLRKGIIVREVILGTVSDPTQILTTQKSTKSAADKGATMNTTLRTSAKLTK